MEKPIIFNTEMVQAILSGKKFQTRRVINPQPISIERCKKLTGTTYSIFQREKSFNQWSVAGPCGVVLKESGIAKNGMYNWHCPYGQKGDILYVRETHYAYGRWVKNGFTKTGKQAWQFIELKLGGNIRPIKFFDNPPLCDERTKKYDIGYFKRNSIHMPKKHARIWLKINNIRVEHIQDISKDDAVDEGIHREWDGTAYWYENYLYNKNNEDANYKHNPVRSFRTLWDTINAKRGFSWKVNPWVWVVEFSVINKKN